MTQRQDILNIIHEDNHIIVLIKPHNVLSQGDETGDENLVDMLKNYLKEKYNKPGNVFVGLVHRLDRPTGGLMVFAKTSKAAERLSKNIQDGEIEKYYLAALSGVPKEKAATLMNYLDKDEVSNTVKVLDFAKVGAKKAELRYKLLESTEDNKLSLVDVELLTGRSHQIRVQMSHIGHPVVGDSKYGKKAGASTHMALWAYRLRFVHPTTKQALVFVAYPDSETEPWKSFSGKSTWSRIAEF